MVLWIVHSWLHFRFPLTFIWYQIKEYMKKSLKIPKGQSESVYRRRTDNTMTKRKSTNNDQQNIHDSIQYIIEISHHIHCNGCVYIVFFTRKHVDIIGWRHQTWLSYRQVVNRIMIVGICLIITSYIRMLDSDWLIAVILFTNSCLALFIVNLQNFYFV